MTGRLIRRSCIAVRMDYNRLIPAVVMIGFFVLFIFPEPESNFAWYVLTILGFGFIVGVLFWLRNSSNF